VSRGAALARDLGLDAEALVVAEDPEIPVSDTVVRVARERGPSDVIRHAPCPVVVVRQRYGTDEQ
jgi:nucleotide-binding universal stress UspA family protein